MPTTVTLADLQTAAQGSGCTYLGSAAPAVEPNSHIKVPFRVNPEGYIFMASYDEMNDGYLAAYNRVGAGGVASVVTRMVNALSGVESISSYSEDQWVITMPDWGVGTTGTFTITINDETFGPFDAQADVATIQAAISGAYLNGRTIYDDEVAVNDVGVGVIGINFLFGSAGLGLEVTADVSNLAPVTSVVVDHVQTGKSGYSKEDYQFLSAAIKDALNASREIL